MRSVRLDDELDARVRRAAALQHVSVSQFLREAAAKSADAVIRDADAEKRNSDRIADIIGSVEGSGRSVASRTGEAFRELLVEQHERKQRRRG